MSITLSRRSLLRHGSSVALGFLGLRAAVQRSTAEICESQPGSYGALQPDPLQTLELPQGFSYQAFSRTGERMDDGFAVPGSHDGMAAFAGPDGKTIIVRNHEMSAGATNTGPFAGAPGLFDRLDRRLIYDPGKGTAPSRGGTTTLVYDTRNRRLERHFLSLTGTLRNCAGGVTPWNTWITCEESVQRATGNFEKDHGYNFEVPASADISLHEPWPLTGMGRFNHEAIAVDPRTSIVYQTEDRSDGLIYRYIPTRPNSVVHGGRLQALALRDRRSADTRNYTRTDLPVGQVLDVAWIDVEDVTSPLDNLRMQGFSNGAARFARGEGMWTGNQSIYFACTDGGPARKGQIFRYVPSPFEGRCEEEKFPGRLELFIEPNDGNLVENADNLTVAPWGDLFLCEDGPLGDSVVGVTPSGKTYPFARNVANESELVGVCFSPDGSTMFVGIQSPGLTFAITGPWAGNQG